MTSHRYRQPETRTKISSQAMRRSVAIAEGVEPSGVVVAAVRELLSRLRSNAERAALLEALSTDPVAALEDALRTYKINGALGRLIRSAIMQQRADDHDHYLRR